MTMIPLRTCNALVSVVAVLSMACGGDETRTPAAPPKPSQPAAAVAKPAVPPPPTTSNQIKVDVRDAEGNPIRFSGIDRDGNPFEARFGDDANVPSEFPSDVPIYPSAKPTAAMTAGDEGVMVTFKSADDQPAIYQFYTTKLSEQGWSITPIPRFGGQMGLEATKSSRKVMVQISGTRGDSFISITVTGAD